MSYEEYKKTIDKGLKIAEEQSKEVNSTEEHKKTMDILKEHHRFLLKLFLKNNPEKE